ncbi:hypothetical protein COLO4_17035 [Corchorus olitorius]|uniref:Uncharacterized protein n=1 Tax=Corchorus olitorius TaxID=93759 RepID=A0A1R3JEI0_9ROSI|nr:hypothetical protein COLO4_17035 [Corchorus olitorius]
MNSRKRYPPGIGVGRGGGVNANPSFHPRPPQQHYLQRNLMLAKEELKPFLPYSSRLAAIDYIACDESDVLVTNNNGNMAKILAGRSVRFVFGLMLNDRVLGLKGTWGTREPNVKAVQRGFMGEPDEMRPGRGEFHDILVYAKSHSVRSQKRVEILSQNKSLNGGREARKKNQHL